MKTNCNYVLQNQVMARSCKYSVSVTSCDIELIKKYPDKFLSLMMSTMRCHELKQNKFWSFEYKKKLKYLVLYCIPSEFIIYLIEKLKMANLFYFYFIFDPLELSISTCQNHKIKIDLAIILVQNAFQFLPVKCDVYNSRYCDMSQDITTLTKALDLIDYVLNKNEVQIPHEFLDLSIHDNLTVNLSKLMSNCKVPVEDVLIRIYNALNSILTK
ncbi:hypothetical protein TKK_0016990 [Trichogramma kaykai]